MSTSNSSSTDIFSSALFEKMKRIDPAVADLELYEFRYGLNNLRPRDGGWESVSLASQSDIERQISSRDFFAHIQLRPRFQDEIVLDASISCIMNMLLVGLERGIYSEEWIKNRFYFDVRGFIFLPRTVYFTNEAVTHLRGEPYKRFEPKQDDLAHYQAIGYKDFQSANAEIDSFFIESMKKLVSAKGTPILVTIAGPTASGKTEIVERLCDAFEQAGKRMTTMEMDHFLLDNDYRDDQGIRSLGKEAYHYKIFMQSLDNILLGKRIVIPQYDSSVSSHDPNGQLKPGFMPIEVEPADIIFLEGNFPFQIPEVANRIGIQIVYLTDDPIRLKRKWKRDMDYRKKYNENYFRNRFFRTQFLRASDCYRSQMQVCDMVVHTTRAELWTTPEIAEILDRG
jgi:uridine kinase